jgi:ribosomal protein L11 methyltransferase
VPRRRFEWLATRLATLGFSAFEEQDCERGARVVVYADDASGTARATLARVAAQLERDLAEGGPEAGASFSVAPVASGWSTEWTKHLGSVELTDRLTVVAGSAPARPRAGRLYLEPAFAFGFGEHPTSRACARFVERYCLAAEPRTVLDVGTGTGVLALVAARSGARRVVGIDTSIEAVRAARHNARDNGCAPPCEFSHGSLDRVAESFELVVANLETAVLLGLAEGLARVLAPGGVLALSGFMTDQCEVLAARYARAGLTLELQSESSPWCLMIGGHG